MPTYVYECQSCGTTLEREQRITEAPLTDCDCGKEGSLKKLIQPTAVMFRGSGFHINDYKSSRVSEKKKESVPKAEGEACGPSCACNPPTYDAAKN
ncbi:MAG: FmdB family zinc ribbon protein [Fimbriimonadaceae bacterium]